MVCSLVPHILEFESETVDLASQKGKLALLHIQDNFSYICNPDQGITTHHKSVDEV